LHFAEKNYPQIGPQTDEAANNINSIPFRGSPRLHSEMTEIEIEDYKNLNPFLQEIFILLITMHNCLKAYQRNFKISELTTNFHLKRQSLNFNFVSDTENKKRGINSSKLQPASNDETCSSQQLKKINGVWCNLKIIFLISIDGFFASKIFSKKSR
jgi:hypothetical protein